MFLMRVNGKIEDLCVLFVAVDEVFKSYTWRKTVHDTDEGVFLRAFRGRGGPVQDPADAGEAALLRGQTHPRLLGGRGPDARGGREARSRVSATITGRLFILFMSSSLFIPSIL